MATAEEPSKTSVESTSDKTSAETRQQTTDKIQLTEENRQRFKEYPTTSRSVWFVFFWINNQRRPITYLHVPVI